MKYIVTRVLLHPGRWIPDVTIKVEEQGVLVPRMLDAGEWVQHPSDGAVGEIVGEFATEDLANERARKLHADNPGVEYRTAWVSSCGIYERVGLGVP